MPCCWDSSSASQNDIWHKMKNFKGIIYAALSSSTFGLAPLFSILLLSDGFSSFEVLSYRWGVASLTLGIIGLAGGCRFRISRQELCTVFFLSLFRAATSLSLVIAYQISRAGSLRSSISCTRWPSPWPWHSFPRTYLVANGSGHRRFAGRCRPPLYRRNRQPGRRYHGGDHCCRRFGIRLCRLYHRRTQEPRGAGRIDHPDLLRHGLRSSAVSLRRYVHGRCPARDRRKERLAILGLALPATAISNITLVRAIKFIGPTLTSISGHWNL